MILNYQYRCYPETSQKLLLNEWLRICRYWYNYQVGDRFKWWQENRESYLIPSGDFCLRSCSVKPKQLRENPSYYSQKRLLPILKNDLTLVKSSVVYFLKFFFDFKSLSIK